MAESRTSPYRGRRALCLLPARVKLSDLDRFWEIRPDVFYLCEFMYGKRRIRHISYYAKHKQ